MIPNSIDRLTAEDINRLLEGRAEEGPTLDFKRDLPGDDRDSRKEFLADVCALANTKGGDLVYGIEEDNEGAAGRVVAHAFNPDAVITQLTNVLNDGLEPRLHGIAMKAIDMGDAGRVLVVRVPRSFAGIHRSLRDAQFWVRESRSKRPLDVAGITGRVGDVLGRQDRLADFFARRYASVATDTYPLALQPGPKVVLHILPTRDVLGGEEVDLAPVTDAGRYWVMPDSTSSFATHVYEGILHHPSVDERTGTVRAGSLVFRSGVVEAIGAVQLFQPEANQALAIPLEAVERHCVAFLQRALRVTVEHLAGGWPVTVRIAVVGHGDAIGRSVDQNIRWHFDDVPAVRVHAGVVQLPDVLLEGPPKSAAIAFRAVFDRLWQAWGYPQSFSFQQEQNGQLRWQGQPQ